jgi:uncharacterized protein (DUF433 family)
MALEARTEHPHIELRPGVCGGEPVVRGSRFPVRCIVEYVIRLGTTPEEMVRKWKHLTLAQVYDALSYYHDHKETIDRLIRKNREFSAPPSRRR